MRQVLILFASQYGYTETYARWIAQDLAAASSEVLVQAQSISTVTPEMVSAADITVVGAGDYGGFLTGATEMKKLLSSYARQKPIFFSVSFSGLEGASREKLDSIVTRNFDNLAQEAEIFHFRGGLDHNRLSLKHKTVMMGIRTAIAALPHKNLANQQMLDSFEQKTVDYTDRYAILPLIRSVLDRLEKK